MNNKSVKVGVKSVSNLMSQLNLAYGKKKCCKCKSKSSDRHAKLAAKAMKLKHKEGISLKAAWKRVRYGKKSEGYYPPALAGYDYNPLTDRYMKKCKSYQTRNENSRCVGRKPKPVSSGSDLASKAMKLKHKEGISLKEAWKRVRYGKKSEGYYPPALAGYDYNPLTDRYMKKCKSYQTRNKNSRCVGRKPKPVSSGRKK